MGTPDFSVPILKKLMDEKYDVIAVVTQPDRPVGRKKKLTAPPVKIEAERLGIPVLQPEKIRDPLEVQKIVDLKPDFTSDSSLWTNITRIFVKGPETWMY